MAKKSDGKNVDVVPASASAPILAGVAKEKRAVGTSKQRFDTLTKEQIMSQFSHAFKDVGLHDQDSRAQSVERATHFNSSIRVVPTTYCGPQQVGPT